MNGFRRPVSTNFRTDSATASFDCSELSSLGSHSIANLTDSPSDTCSVLTVGVMEGTDEGVSLAATVGEPVGADVEVGEEDGLSLAAFVGARAWTC